MNVTTRRYQTANAAPRRDRGVLRFVPSVVLKRTSPMKRDDMAA